MSHLRRRGDGWFFRRMMPLDIRQAIGRVVVERTLETRSHRTALMRSAACFLVSENAIAAARSGDVAGAIQLLADMKAVAPWSLSQLRERTPGPWDPAAFNSQSEVRPLPPVRRVVNARGSAVPALPRAFTDRRGQKKAAAHGPRFSDLVNEFIAEKTRSGAGHRGYSAQTVSQTRATFRLWVELVGDGPVSAITGAQAGRFREELLQMPASHGKGVARNARSVLDALILTGKNQDTSTLSMKTVKRHFSSLSQYAEWLLQREHVTSNPFTGFDFPGTGASRTARDAWSDENLLKLMSSPWMRGILNPRIHDVIGAEAARWIPLIAMFSGMRIEEICRLRVVEDCTEIDCVPCFLVQEQPARGRLAAWSPKTAAGERVVPVHPELLNLGIGDLMIRRRQADDYRLFPRLRHSGPDNKLSDEFSREFSRRKVRVGIPAATSFHSFRHNVSTILRNRDTEIREAWIDAVLGHDSGQKSQGVRTYLKSVGIQNLHTTVNAITYSDVVMAAIRKLQLRGD